MPVTNNKTIAKVKKSNKFFVYINIYIYLSKIMLVFGFIIWLLMDYVTISEMRGATNSDTKVK